LAEVENATVTATDDGNRGLQGKTPTLEQQISAFKGASFEDGALKGAQDGKTAITAATEPVEGAEGTEGVVAPTEKPKAKSAQERIDQAVRKQRTAERDAQSARDALTALNERLARLEGRLEGRPLTETAKGTSPAARDASAPDPAKYQYGDLDPRFIADLARHETTKLIEADKTARESARRTEAEQQAKAAFDATKAKFTTAAVAKYPDFQETVLDTVADWDLSQTVGELALESDAGPEILYHLATHADESKALAKLSPAKQAAWFGKMEASFASPAASSAAAAGGRSAPTATRMTQAPAVPATRVRGNGNPSPVSPDTTDFKAFERLAASSRH